MLGLEILPFMGLLVTSLSCWRQWWNESKPRLQFWKILKLTFQVQYKPVLVIQADSYGALLTTSFMWLYYELNHFTMQISPLKLVTIGI